jgi:hypothetical protein
LRRGLENGEGKGCDVNITVGGCEFASMLDL